MIKRNLALLTIMLFLPVSAWAIDNSCNSDYSFLVLEEKTGNIILNNKSEKIAYPASLVKVMTLYLTFEAIENKKLSLEQELTFSELGEELSKVNKINTLNIKEGDKITVKQAIEAVIVKSFNEAAVTLSEAVSGSEWQFVRKMNLKAKELGMINTSFRNSSGLHEEGQYSNAYDLARLTIAIKQDFPQYYHFFALKEFSYKKHKFKTHNNILLNYKGAEGMKTGFTKASGYNLISLAKKDDDRLISILLGCESSKKRDKMTENLFDKAFEESVKKDRINVKLEKKFNYNIED